MGSRDSRESVHRAAAWALQALRNVEERHDHHAELASIIRDAREEVQGASVLTDSGEQAG